MMELGKRSNGVTLFDNEQLVKIDIIRMDDKFLIYFNTKYYDLLKGKYFQWLVYAFEIYKKENPELCLSFDEFFKKALELLLNDGKKSKVFHKYDINKKSLLVHEKAQYQVNYPSDDDKYRYATSLGVTELNDLGYSIDFDKSSKDRANLIFILKKDGHYPELAKIYSELFLQMFDLAERSYDDCQAEFDYSYIRKIKSN